MHESTSSKPSMILSGVGVRTNLANEMNPLTARIPATLQHYTADFQHFEGTDLLDPYSMYCVYTDYVSDYRGDYTYFVGTPIKVLEKTHPLMQEHGNPLEKDTFTPTPLLLSVPSQTYHTFHAGPGPMPATCIAAWQDIWKKEVAGELAGKRTYIADFECYDTRHTDLMSVSFDVCVGIARQNS